ncbi:putative transposase [Streptantibioticus cattleyicolor NRRL 8057 = DSM 46488]|uniref:Putative transposase n=1 Tax=Streptantibioticus cattleyicolor (strain ATCC 35852 / DSM 46488 / JCM 4925 / NBRC 14057 / NRRL 8057) TaxID=1003195 RepID=G8X1G4_STREN|nr:putative transposase [Streptantibioticus cattleyicolor NRRL 8057 = DSM 46488]
MLWTTGYIDAAVAQLWAGGHEIRDEGVAGLSPLKHKNFKELQRAGLLWLHRVRPGRWGPVTAARLGCPGVGGRRG